jgi:hypothetical protein
MTKIVARRRFDFRAATGSTALLVSLGISMTALETSDTSVRVAVLVLGLAGLWLIIDSLGSTLTFSDEVIRFRAVTHRWQSWPLDGRSELRHVGGKITSRWGLSKPEYLVLLRRTDNESIALVDGQLSRQAEWRTFLEEQITQGRLHASPEAISMLKHLGRHIG